MNLKEHILKNKRVYTGGIINVDRQKVQIPTGETAERDVVHNAPAVSALVIDRHGNLIMEQQWREPVRRVTWEIPAGKVDSRDNGSADHAIKRELNEELRISLDSHSTFKKLFTGFSSPGFSDEKDTMYLVKNYHSATKDLPRDKGEYLKLHHIPLAKAWQMVKNGQIADSKSIIAILYYIKMNLKISQKSLITELKMKS